jgi:hypothetical protein
VSAAPTWDRRVLVRARAHTSVQRTGVTSWLTSLGDTSYTDTVIGTQTLGERYAQQTGHWEVKHKDGTTERYWYVCVRMARTPLDRRSITTFEKVNGKWKAISDALGEIK